MNDTDFIKQMFTGDEDEAEALPSFSLCRSPEVIPVNPAHIASDLAKLTENTIGPGSRVFIVGNDGPNISKENYPWLDLLKTWLEKGCNVEYLLVDSNSKSIGSLLQFRKKLNSKAGRLRVYTVKDKARLSREASDYVRQWATFHFAVFENPPQLWVESCHKPGEVEATGCAFFPEEVAKKPAVTAVYKSRFDYMINEGYATELN